MDSLVGAIAAALFGGIGAGIIWIFKKGETPFKEILHKQIILSDIIGLVVILLFGWILYLLKNLS